MPFILSLKTKKEAKGALPEESIWFKNENFRPDFMKMLGNTSSIPLRFSFGRNGNFLFLNCSHLKR